MNLSHFCIDRPIFASVISIVITLAGALAMLNLPIAQYPEITPPQGWRLSPYSDKILTQKIAKSK